MKRIPNESRLWFDPFLAYVLTAPQLLHSAFFILPSAFPLSRPRNCGDCRLKAASQERRLQAADELHNPANRLTPSAEPRRLRFE